MEAILNEEENHPDQKEPADQEADSWFEDDQSLGSSLQSDGEEMKHEEINGKGLKEERKEEKAGTEVAKEQQACQLNKKYVSCDHNIDRDFHQLLLCMVKEKLIDIKKIAQLAQGEVDLTAPPGKIVIKTTSLAQSNPAIQNISNFVDSLSLLKLGCKGQTAVRYANFKSLKQFLRKENIVLFESGNYKERTAFIGGIKKTKQLELCFKKIKSLRVVNVRLNPYQNTRSYNIILDEIISGKDWRDANKNSQISFLDIDRSSQDKNLRVNIATLTSKQHFKHQFEDMIMNQVNQYYVLTFCYDYIGRYVAKPNCQNISFRIISEKNQSRSYLYIIALKKHFIAKKNEIYECIEKIGGKIKGVRFFYHLKPDSRQFTFEKHKYSYTHYPKERAYSITYFGKEREGQPFQWKEFYKRFIQIGEKDKVIKQDQN